jgi:DNA repair photolyase
MTKSSAVLRDLDVLSKAARQQAAYVMVSLSTLDADHHRRLADAGIPVGVSVAPLFRQWLLEHMPLKAERVMA